MNDLNKLFRQYKEKGTGATIDSRTIAPGQLFFALSGNHVNGHKYVQSCYEKGALGAVISDPAYIIEGFTVMVEDVTVALQWMGRQYRNSYDIPVLAITGSNGKTTTKELIAAVLEKKFKTHYTSGNYNNHLGVPLTILNAPFDSQLLVIEMGANKIGDISELCEIADPTHGLITNIGKAHLLGFGSVNGVIQAKTELYRYIKDQSGTLFYNKEDEILVAQLPTDVETIPYRVESHDFRTQHLKLEYRFLSEWIPTQLYGEYNMTNIASAIAIGLHYGIPAEDCVQAISEYHPTMNRSQVETIGNHTIIMDAYNANPTSMKHSVESFARTKTDKPKVLILGDMKELGVDEIQYHKALYDMTSSLDVWKYRIFVGSIFQSVVEETPTTLRYLDINEFTQDITTIKEITEDAIILIKASRSLQLEKIKTLLENYNS